MSTVKANKFCDIESKFMMETTYIKIGITYCILSTVTKSVAQKSESF